MKNKAQSAMEYLMTYGWAILIVIVVVAALYSMGVFSTKGGVPCSPCFSKFAYVDYSAATAGNGVLKLTNGPETINITTITSTPTTGATIDDTQSYCLQYAANCTSGKSIVINNIGTTGDQTITIDYITVSSGLSHSDTATIHNP